MPTFAHFEILAVMVDRGKLQQVFMNLMLNAIEAVKESVGELTVKSPLFQASRFSFFKNAANRGSPCKFLNKGSTFVSIRPLSRWA